VKTLVLQGFGISIKVENGQLLITGGKDRITRQQQIIEITDNANFDKIIIEGSNGWISFKALEWLSYLGINVIMVDSKGRLYGNFNQIKGDTEPTIRQEQYDCFRNEKHLAYLRKWIVTERISTQSQLLRERAMYDKLSLQDKEAVEITVAIMEKNLESIDKHGINKLRSIEAYITKRYYTIFPRLFKQDLGFETRRNRYTSLHKDATDVINALLNYGFSILQAEVSKQLNAIGFDSNVGFYHKNHPTTVPLVYDMMEPSRHLVERAVLEIADSIDKEKDYRFVYYDRSYPFSKIDVPITWLQLSDNLKRRFVFQLTTVFNRKRYYKTPEKTHTGIVPEHGYQKLEELTIMKMKCIELRNYILKERRIIADKMETGSTTHKAL
jgi:CRISP-associated protein Cas1